MPSSVRWRPPSRQKSRCQGRPVILLVAPPLQFPSVPHCTLTSLPLTAPSLPSPNECRSPMPSRNVKQPAAPSWGRLSPGLQLICGKAEEVAATPPSWRQQRTIKRSSEASGAPMASKPNSSIHDQKTEENEVRVLAVKLTTVVDTFPCHHGVAYFRRLRSTRKHP